VGGLDPDDLLERPADAGAQLGDQVVRILLAGAHAVVGDVEEGEDAGARLVDDALLEAAEVQRARGSGIDHGGHAGAPALAVGHDAAAEVLGEDMTVDVDVDQARHHVHAGHVHHLLRRVGGNGGIDGGYLAFGDG
jgi:hypothetical protein